METLEYENKKGEIYKFWMLDTHPEFSFYIVETPRRLYQPTGSYMFVFSEKKKDGLILKDAAFDLDLYNNLHENKKPVNFLPINVAIEEDNEGNVIILIEEQNIEFVNLQEIKDWFHTLHSDTEFIDSFKSSNECGCLLTQFFKAKDVDFETCSGDGVFLGGRPVAKIDGVAHYVYEFLDMFRRKEKGAKVTKAQILEKYPDFLK